MKKLMMLLTLAPYTQVLPNHITYSLAESQEHSTDSTVAITMVTEKDELSPTYSYWDNSWRLTYFNLTK